MHVKLDGRKGTVRWYGDAGIKAIGSSFGEACAGVEEVV
jgi:hypothetical protein